MANNPPVFRCVNPLLLENDMEEYPYANGGSSVLVFYNACLFLVTAKHCLQNNDAHPKDVFIPDGSDEHKCLAFDRLSVGEEQSDDKDYADFAILRVRAETVGGKQLRNLYPWPITEATIVEPQNPNVDALFAQGYPLDMNAIDYEARKIPRRPLRVGGRYAGRDGQSHVHILQYAEPGTEIPGTDGNGMSGGGVFAQVKNSELPIKFAGIVLRGGHKSGLWRFASSIVLWSALKDLERRGEVVPLSNDLIRVVMDHQGLT